MKLVPVEKIPNRKSGHHYLEEMVKEFMDGNHDICEVDIKEHEYKHPIYCYKGFHLAIKRMGIKTVKAKYSNGKTYLVKVAI